MEKLKEIIRNNNMSTRPEYYSGRGATISDLNEKILFGIHKDLKKEFGESAGNGFVKMVNGIKVLSATAFLGIQRNAARFNFNTKRRKWRI